MDTKLIVALIALITAVISGSIAIYGQIRIAQLQDQLLFKRERRLKEEKAEEILSKYREPLLHAAYELQSRLYNILQKGLLQVYYSGGTDREQKYTVENTLYVIAQYFGWTEIIRNEVQFLNLGDVKATRMLAQLQEKIRIFFLSDTYEKTFRVFRGEQRAIGERMIILKNDNYSCMGYATFVELKELPFQYWLESLRQDIVDFSKDFAKDNERLMNIQHALIDLIEYLDPDYMRFDRNYCRKV